MKHDQSVELFHRAQQHCRRVNSPSRTYQAMGCATPVLWHRAALTFTMRTVIATSIIFIRRHGFRPWTSCGGCRRRRRC